MAEHVMTEPDWPGSKSDPEASGKVEAARTAAADVSSTARQAVGGVKQEAGRQARVVATEFGDQARQLFDTTTVELKDQAAARAERLAGGLRSLSGQVRALAEGRPEDAGQLRDLAGDVQGRLQAVANRIDEGGLDGLMADVGQFARRRPFVFLAGCAGAGFVLGRVVRTARAATGNGDGRVPATPAMGRTPPAGSLGTSTPADLATPVEGVGLGVPSGAGTTSSAGMPGSSGSPSSSRTPSSTGMSGSSGARSGLEDAE